MCFSFIGRKRPYRGGGFWQRRTRLLNVLYIPFREATPITRSVHIAGSQWVVTTGRFWVAIVVARTMAVLPSFRIVRTHRNESTAVFGNVLIQVEAGLL